MNRAALVASATLLDRIIGDPEHFPHPVRLMGLAIAEGEILLRRSNRSLRSSFYDLSAGAALTGLVIFVSYKATSILMRKAYQIDPHLGTSVEVILASSCLAARDLEDEAGSVLRALEIDNLPRARVRLARIVGRDTELLDSSGISRALIETLAESLCDGVIAPLFFLTLGGVPAAMAFKAISTLDSMIGYRTPRYLFFGKAAARLDDVVNFLPARLTALLILSVASKPKRDAVNVYCRDRNAHASPNAGHPEAAIAGALKVRLGGVSTYKGEIHHAPLIGAEFPLPTIADAKRALRTTRTVSLLATFVALALLASRPRRGKA